MFALRFNAAFAALILGLVGFAHAQSAPTGVEAEVEAASAAARAAQIVGPGDIPLGSQAHLSLPAGFAFIPAAEGARLMHAMGNQTDDGFMGLVVGEHMAGFMTIRFDPSGYIKDDDAREWDADEMLQNLKDGTEAGNEERRNRGIPEFTVDGWVEPPGYDPANQRLVWSAKLRDKIATPNAGSPTVNYNTYLLGREGYISMNLITDLANVDNQKPVAHELLNALRFNDGKRYADFNAETDTVAAYGLAALVGGVAAKKLGLLAAAGVFLAKFWKLAAIGVVAVGAIARRFLGGKRNAA